MLFPDSKSPAAGKMLTPLEVRSRRFKCPSALEAGVPGKKNLFKHNTKSSANVIRGDCSSSTGFAVYLVCGASISSIPSVCIS